MIFETTLLRADPLPERPDWIIIVGESTARVFCLSHAKLVFVKDIFSVGAARNELEPPDNKVVIGDDGRRYKSMKSEASRRRDAAVFCQELAASLDSAQEGEFGNLFLIGAPVILAWLKGSLSPQTLDRIVAESETDMINLTARDLEKYVAGLFPLQSPSVQPAVYGEGKASQAE